MCDILIRSYWRDLAWLGYCLDSIRRWCNGFRSVIVVVPEASRSRLRRLDLSDVRIAHCPDYRDDYLGQQVTKLYADELTDADFISHVDSDCVFTRTVMPSMLLDRGRARVSLQPTTQLGRHRPWEAPTSRFLGFAAPYDFMVHPPFTYPRWLYSDVRAIARERHGEELAEYVLHQPPRGFSEFNVLGAVAFARHRSRFSWVAAADGPELCNWYWSWGGLTPELRVEIERILAS